MPLKPALMWVFAHGSLMFQPHFEHVERRPARVAGYQRRFGQPSGRNWGRPEYPAPTCSLVPGSAVDGVAFGIAPEKRETILRSIRNREAREPIEVRAETEGGAVEVLTWTMDCTWAEHSVEELVSAALINIERGGGPFGDAWSYLDGVKRSLDALGVQDGLVFSYHAALTAALRRYL